MSEYLAKIHRCKQAANEPWATFRKRLRAQIKNTLTIGGEAAERGVTGVKTEALRSRGVGKSVSSPKAPPSVCVGDPARQPRDIGSLTQRDRADDRDYHGFGVATYRQRPKSKADTGPENGVNWQPNRNPVLLLVDRVRDIQGDR